MTLSRIFLKLNIVNGPTHPQFFPLRFSERVGPGELAKKLHDQTNFKPFFPKLNIFEFCPLRFSERVGPRV